MKKQTNNLYITFFFLCVNFSLFAEPGSGNSTGDIETTDVAAPIDSYLWMLVLVGLMYVFLKLNAKQKTH